MPRGSGCGPCRPGRGRDRRALIGVERDRALDVGHRNIEPPGLAIDQPAVGIGRSAIGIEADHLVEIGQCFVGLAGLRQCRAALVVGYRIVRAILDGLAERGEVDGRGELRRFFRLAGRRQRAQIDRAATERHRNQCDGCGRSRTMTRSSGQRVANRIGHLLDILTRHSFIAAIRQISAFKKIARKK
jgi:hypothetical protein